MTEKRPVPLQHVLLYKDKFTVVKNEVGIMDKEALRKVIKEENEDNRKKRFEN